MEPTTLSGPVAARAEIVIDAPQRVVWAVLADIDGWPTWNPAVRQAALRDELEVDGRFQFSDALGSLRCRLSEVDAPRLLAWSGGGMLMRHRQTWWIVQAGGGCRVATEAAMSGVGVWVFKSRFDERLQADLDAQVQLLKLEAETRTSDDDESDAEPAVEVDVRIDPGIDAESSAESRAETDDMSRAESSAEADAGADPKREGR